MRQHTLSVSRAVESFIRAGMLVSVLSLLLSVCACAPSATVSFWRHKASIPKLWFAQCPAQSRCSVMLYWFIM